MNKREKKSTFVDVVLDRVRTIRSKTKCFDLFHNVQINSYRMYPTMPINKLVNYRVKKKKLHLLRSKLTLMKNLKAFSGFGRCTYIDIVLKELQVTKIMFMMDLCMGDEVIIPPHMQTSKLPLSYRFYDSTFKMILDRINDE